MKKLILMIGAFSILNGNLCLAQDEDSTKELKDIGKEDIIEQYDRSEFENEEGEIEVETIKPDLAMPTIEFEDKKNKSSNKSTNKINNKTANNDSKQKETNQSLNTKKDKAEQKTKKNKPKRTKVLVSKKRLSINQLEKNDKIVVNDGITYIYRIQKSNVIQHVFRGSIPFDSAALKSNGKNSYYLMDVDQLVLDENRSKNVNSNDQVSGQRDNQKNKQENEQENKQEEPSKIDSNSQQTPSTSEKKTDKKSQQAVVTAIDELAQQRKDIEEKYNQGKPITKSIKLKALKVNDKVYVFGDLQLVIRRDLTSLNIRKYWLSEKLNTKSLSVKTLSENKYKIIRRYK